MDHRIAVYHGLVPCSRAASSSHRRASGLPQNSSSIARISASRSARTRYRRRFFSSRTLTRPASRSTRRCCEVAGPQLAAGGQLGRAALAIPGQLQHPPALRVGQGPQRYLPVEPRHDRTLIAY